MHPHRSNALHGAAAVLTVTLRRGVAVSLSWSWSHQPQGRACAAAPAHVDTKGRTPYRSLERTPRSRTPARGRRARGLWRVRGP